MLMWLRVPVYRVLFRLKFSTRNGRMIKCLLTEFGRAGRKNILLEDMTHGPHCAWSVRYDVLRLVREFLGNLHQLEYGEITVIHWC